MKGKLKKLRTPSGIVTEFMTIAQLAELAGKKPITVRKWEEKSWLPVANFNAQKIILSDGTERKGAKLYSVKYGRQIAKLIQSVKRGEPMDNEVIRQVALLMKNEKLEYATKQK